MFSVVGIYAQKEGSRFEWTRVSTSKPSRKGQKLKHKLKLKKELLLKS